MQQEPEYKYNATATIEIELDCDDMQDAKIKVSTIVENGLAALKYPNKGRCTGAKIVNTETKYYKP